MIAINPLQLAEKELKGALTMKKYRQLCTLRAAKEDEEIENLINAMEATPPGQEESGNGPPPPTHPWKGIHLVAGP